jgi:hypothetical protein
MDALLNAWRNSFYTEPLLFLVIVVAFVISVKKRRVLPILKFVPVYFAMFAVLFLLLFLGLAVLRGGRYYNMFLLVDKYAEFVLTVTELIVFSDILAKVIKHKLIKRLVRSGTVIMAVVFVVYLIVDIFNYNGPRSITNQRLYIIESLFFLSSCIVYMIELFRFPPYFKLVEQPSFWVVTGLFFFVVSTLPVTLLLNYLKQISYDLYAHFFSIIYLSYILLFIMICKAYLCKPILTK